MVDCAIMDYTRRELGRLLLSSVPLSLVLKDRPANSSAGNSPAAKPNSVFAGVTVAMNVPYNYGARTMPVDEVQKTDVSGLWKDFI